jgi:hypothetical protein
MNDDDLTTTLREPFADVHMTIPIEAVVHRGGKLRSRRRIWGLSGAVALIGGAAAAVALLAPGAHVATARLAAWTVTKNAEGITIVINELKDPAGLQASLRADGVPARVTFDPLNWLTQPLPKGCQAPEMSDRANAGLQRKILTPPAVLAYENRMRAEGVRETVIPPSLYSPAEEMAVLYVDPAAIPPGIGLSLGVSWKPNGSYGIGVDLVVTSPQCTGS